MMKRTRAKAPRDSRAWVGILGVALLSTACESVTDLDQAVSMKLDPSLTGSERRLLKSDIQSMLTYRVSGGAADLKDPAGEAMARLVDRPGWYEKVFGGASGLQALRFMDERVNYVVSSRVNDKFRLFVDQAHREEESDSSGLQIVAANFGMSFWFESQVREIPLGYQVGDLRVRLDSPRVGLIKIYPGYTQTISADGTPITSVFRTSTLVHEARHSDCSGGLKRSTLASARATGMIPEEGLSCGHFHITCPPGSLYAGAAGACDGKAWGAYAIGGIYAAQIANQCTNCSELERQQALLDAADEFSRVTVLKEMVLGIAGEPDLSSNAQVVD